MIAIIGPTGSGKTEFSIKLSEKIPINVINADSRQIYKYMNIGTAKPTLKQRSKVKHYIVDQVYPNINYSLNNFINDAKESYENILLQDLIPIIVGGTGLYIWALLDDWQLPDVPPDQEYRNYLEIKIKNNKPEYLSNLFISKIGHENSKNFDLKNNRRLIRYLEIIKTIGSEAFLSNNKKENNNHLIIGLDYCKNTQEQKLSKRIDKMFDEGWINEVENLMQKGYNLSHYSMSGIGYKEIYLYLTKDIDHNKMRELIIKRTLNLVKKQRTWFKKSDKRINWIDNTKSSNQVELIKNKIIKYREENESN